MEWSNPKTIAVPIQKESSIEMAMAYEKESRLVSGKLEEGTSK